MLTEWLDKVDAGRRDIATAFERLQFFAQNVRARDQLDGSLAQRIEHFVQVALACHLDLMASAKTKTKKDEQPVCDLCEAKSQLLRYECVLFAMTIDKSGENSKGSWNASYQECILKGNISWLCVWFSLS